MADTPEIDQPTPDPHRSGGTDPLSAPRPARPGATPLPNHPGLGASGEGPGPYGNGQHTQPLPTDAPAAPYGSTPPVGPGGAKPVAAPPQQRTGLGRLLGAAGAAALLAAVLASAGTYALTHGDGDGSVVETGNRTVVNADPADFADKTGVNWTATAAKVNPSVVSIAVQSADGSSGGEGSGVVLDTSGNIVTNNHVVAPGASGGKVQVTLNNNRIYPATIVGRDPSTDLAVIRISDAGKLTPAQMNDGPVVVGQPAMAMGNPLGLSETATTGIVSALERPVVTSDDNSASTSDNNLVVTNAIQTSAAINPGNSGGALVNASGKLIGITSSIASLPSSSSSGQSGNIGIGFAIPTAVVKSITHQLLTTGKAQHPLLGIGPDDSVVRDGSGGLASAKVKALSPGGAAAKAGIKVGDDIIALDGSPITSSDSLIAQVRSRAVGSTVKVTLIRDGQRKDVQVTLGSADSK